jgi:phosphoglycolate phosphatase-like HAD superfamily hydrolase
MKEKSELDTIIRADTILFFDMDGTLIDTDYANFLAYKKAIHSVTNNGLELSFNPQNRFNRSYLKAVFPNLTQIDYEEIIQKKEDYYKDYLSETKLNEKIAKVLFRYSKTNETFLVTNCRKDRALMTLNYFGLTDKFDDIFYRHITDNTGKVNKFKNAILKLGVPPNLVVVFEHEEIEIAYAKEAGIEIINPIIV